jgi:hypothetical protein
MSREILRGNDFGRRWNLKPIRGARGWLVRHFNEGSNQNFLTVYRWIVIEKVSDLKYEMWHCEDLEQANLA